MPKIRTFIVILGMAAMMACGGDKTPKRKTERPKASLARLDQRQRVQALEAELFRMDQLIEQMSRQQQVQISQARDLSQQLALQLTELKKSIGVETAPVKLKLPAVSDEEASLTAKAIEPPSRAYSLFKNLCLLLILLAAAYFIYKFVMPSHEDDEDLDEDDEDYESPEAMSDAGADTAAPPASETPSETPPPADDQKPA